MWSLWRMAVSLLLSGLLPLIKPGLSFVSPGGSAVPPLSDIGEERADKPSSGGKVKHGLQWPVNRVVEMSGDLVLGGLHMVHERDDSWVCGRIMPQVSNRTATVTML